MRFAIAKYRHGEPFSQRGAVLLEVVLALVLFVGAAAIVSAGLNAAVNSVERLRSNTHAADLAVSVISELQIGNKTAALAGAQPFEAPFEGWNWEVIVAPVESDNADMAGPRKVEVVIRHAESGLVHRACEMIQFPDLKPAGEGNAMFGSSAL